jgi:hypothetical protein
MAKGIIYADENDLRNILKLPEHCVVTNVVHNPYSGDVEFIIHSPYAYAGVTHDVENAKDCRRSKISS